MHKPNRTIAIVAALMLSAVLPAFAGSKGRQNSAMALTAATVYAAFQKNKLPAVALALGSAQAWKSYEDVRKRESRENSYRSYNRRGYYDRTPAYRQSDRNDRGSYACQSHREDRRDSRSRQAYSRHSGSQSRWR